MTFPDIIEILLFALAGWNLGQFVGVATDRVTGMGFMERFVNSVFIFCGAVVVAGIAHLIAG